MPVIAVLAVCIGANVAVFSVIDAVVLRSLPIKDPDRVVMIWEKNATLGPPIGDRVPAAYTNFLEWTERATQFEEIAGFEDANFNFTNGAEPERIEGARASRNIFELFGVRPRLGAPFDATGRDSERVVILTDSFTKTHFGSDRSLLGRTLILNDAPYTVIGVLPASFHLPAAREGQEQHSPQLWVPYESSAQHDRNEARRRRMQVYGRLRENVSLDQARAEMNAIAKQMAEADPTQNAGFGVNVFPVRVENAATDLRRNLVALLVSVGFVLLIGCANVANLMLTQSVRRQKEMAVRKALGAGSGRLISQLLAESLILSGLGALAGLALAHIMVKLVVALRPDVVNRPEDIHLNLLLLGFTVLLSILAAVLSGAIPAVLAARADLNSLLKQARNAGTSASSVRARRLLVVGEVALACVLLVGATLMIRSLLAVLGIDPGFRAERLVTMKFSLPASHYSNDDEIAAFCRDARERISTLPGITSASFSDGLPMTRLRMTRLYGGRRTRAGERKRAHGRSPRYFRPDLF